MKQRNITKIIIKNEHQEQHIKNMKSEVEELILKKAIGKKKYNH